MSKFLTALSLLLVTGFATGAHAAVAWGENTSGYIDCFPADAYGDVIPNSYPVDKSYCYESGGVEWAISTRNTMICVPNYGIATNHRTAISDSYCLSKYRGHWDSGRDGYTHCYANYPGFSIDTQYPIDEYYCAY